jgi:hypothetical protein
MKTVAACYLFLPGAWSFVLIPQSTTYYNNPAIKQNHLFASSGLRLLSLVSTKQQQQQQQQQHVSASMLFADAARRTETCSNSSSNTFDAETMTKQHEELMANQRMSDFFLTHYDWQPLFRSLCVDSSVPAVSFLGTTDDSPLSGINGPWSILEAIPSEGAEKQVVADFLDSMQQTLLEQIDDDTAFIWEGRRMLAVSRFQVFTAPSEKTRNDDVLYTPEDRLFATCWNELSELARNDQMDTGSLIVLPTDYDDNYNDALHEFLSTSIRQPLEWLGLDPYFEIAAIQRSDSTALRLLHKLSNIPTDVGGEIIEM